MRPLKNKTLAKHNRDDRQTQIKDWVVDCYGEAAMTSQSERASRFLEEALELVQACDLTAEAARNLVNYVFSRPKGEVGQELGGVGVTLLSLAEAMQHSADEEEAREVDRVLRAPRRDFRLKQNSKAKKGVGISIPEVE